MPKIMILTNLSYLLDFKCSKSNYNMTLKSFHKKSQYNRARIKLMMEQTALYCTSMKYDKIGWNKFVIIIAFTYHIFANKQLLLFRSSSYTLRRVKCYSYVLYHYQQVGFPDKLKPN